MAKVEIVSGERPYYTVRVTLDDGRTFDQPVYVDVQPVDVPASLADYAADMQANMPPLTEHDPAGD